VTQKEAPYRSDIDGLRAVSILSVVLYHAHPWLVPGGFVGVDVFFVISGFLISRIILSQCDAGHFSLLNFYARRIRRIIPALLTVSIATCVIGWFVLLPDQFVLLGKNIVASVSFAANLYQLGQTGYFAPDAAENPLLHLWSLGVEEQFYILWPLTLLFLSVSSKRVRWIWLIALASFCIGLSIFAGYAGWAFYSPLPRAWELLAGALLANHSLRSKNSVRSMPDNLLSSVGIAAILAAAFTLDRARFFPGFYALLPVVGATLVIASPNGWVNRLLLSNRLMVLIGLISYPLYLWHWPLFSYLAILRNGVPNFLEIWAAGIVAIVLSILTYRFIETPLRQRNGAAARLLVGMALVGAFGIVAIGAAGFGFRFSPQIQEIARIRAQDNSGFRDKCFLEAPGTAFNEQCIEPGTRPLVFIWGDSTAAALYPGLKAAQSKRGSFRLARYTSPGCAPILDAGTNARCDETNRIAYGFLKSSHPDLVLLHAMWGSNNDLPKLRATIAQLRSIGIPRIVVLGPVPVWKRTLPHTLVNHYRFLRTIPDRIATGVSGPTDDDRLIAFSNAEGIEYISAWRTLCNADGCLTRSGPAASDILVTDIIHLSDQGSRYLIDAINDRLLLP
jgi:peptidoglycan/LPS O-acetylase OafA/YrhL